MEPTDLERICLVNNLPFPTAINRITIDLYHATDNKANVINLGSHDNSWSTGYEGALFRGRFKASVGLSNAFNYTFPKLSYKGLVPLLNKIKDKGGIFHYTNQSVNPLRKNEKDIVYINDNPQAVVNTDLYSLSPARRILTKRHYIKFSKFRNVTVNSNYVKESLRNFGFEGDIQILTPLPSPNIRKIENKSALRKSLGLPENKTLVLSITNGVKRKNLEFVKEVISKLDDNYRLVRIGERLGDSITYENVSDEMVNRIFNAVDILFFPSLEEGFGLPVIDAMKLGIPAIVSDIEVMHEVTGGNAMFVDPHSISDGLRSVKEAASFSNDLTIKAQDFAKLYSIERFRDEVKNYYLGVLKQ